MDGRPEQEPPSPATKPALSGRAATSASLAELFGDGPFARLENFDNAVLREQSPLREPPEFKAHHEGG